MYFSEIAFSLKDNSKIQFLLSINTIEIVYIINLLKFKLFESQITFIVRRLLCRNEVRIIGLCWKVIEELQNIFVLFLE